MSNLSDTGNLMHIWPEEIKIESVSEDEVRKAEEAFKIDSRNWIPVMVVETGEDEYICLHGAATVQVAKNLGIRVWAIICPPEANEQIQFVTTGKTPRKTTTKTTGKTPRKTTQKTAEKTTKTTTKTTGKTPRKTTNKTTHKNRRVPWLDFSGV